MPTWFHALISSFLVRHLQDFSEQHRLGLAVAAQFYVRLWPEEIRQPDVVFCFHENIPNRKEIQDGADLVMEVVSEGTANRQRDLVQKREAYAKAGIREYWIVDPQTRTISVLTLAEGTYRTAGEYPEGTRAASVLLPGFEIDVAAAFAAGEK